MKKNLLFMLLFSNLLLGYSPKQNNFSKKPTIIILHSRGEGGGVANHVIKLCQNLIQDNFDVTVLTHNNKIIKKFKELSIPFVFFQNKKNLIKQFANICHIKKPEIVHINHLNIPIATLTTLKNISPSTKFFFTFHGSNQLKSDFFKTLSFFDLVSIVDWEKYHHINDILLKKNLATPCIWTFPVYDDEKFNKHDFTQTRQHFFLNQFGLHISDNMPTICIVAGRLSKNKNQKCAILALFRLLNKHNIKAHIFMLGKIDEQSKYIQTLKRLIKNLNLKDYVHLIGYRNDVYNILHYSDFKILPSKKESFGIVLVEAGLMKKPIIVSDAITASKILIFHKKTGLVFKNNDHKDLALQMKVLIENHLFAQELGQNAHDYTEQYFSSKAAYEKFKQLYMSLYANKNMPT